MKVFVTDDHPIMYDGYKALFESWYGKHELVGTAKNGEELINWLEDNTCDVVLLDLSMPVMNGVEVLKHFFAKKDIPKFLIVTADYSMTHVRECLVLKAKGFIDKSEVFVVLEEALAKVERGKRFLSDSVQDELTNLQLDYEYFLEPEDVLSIREAELLSYMTKNLSNKEICKEMEISPSTFNSFTARIREKLGIKTNVGLVINAIKHNFNLKK